MKPVIKIAVLLFVLIIMESSCRKKFFDLEPFDALPIESATQTEADLDVAANGMYASLRDVDLYGRTLPLKGDLASDNVYLKTSNSGRYLTFRDFNQTTANAEANNVWDAAYAAIKNANLIINAEIEQTELVDQLKGEALTVRALMHFELVRNYASTFTVNPNALGVPIVTEFNQNALPSRNTVQEVYDQIISDLKAAFALMTLNQGESLVVSTTNKVRTVTSENVSKFTAEALLAKVYLTMGSWQLARDAALDVVNNSGFTLVTAAAFQAYWANPAGRVDQVETMFEISSDAAANLSSDQLSFFYDPAGYGDALITNDLISQYSPSDVRLEVINTDSLSGALVFINNKYSNSENPADKDDSKVLRFADVVLILAEASAQLNNTAVALSNLNRVAQTRDPLFGGFSSTGAQLISDIINERRKELAFEGDRYWDLMRLNLPITNHIKNQNPFTPFPIAVTDIHRLFPIPQNEIDVNPNIAGQQNPGF
ncbi:MAG: RagB/SusD family nutrient uptake outer membrane protein [Chitinophagaceae bacterium]